MLKGSIPSASSNALSASVISFGVSKVWVSFGTS